MILEYEGYEVLEASSGPDGVTMAERESPDLVFLDIKMPGMDGLDALQRIKASNETLPVVIISGHGTVSTAVEATKAGAFDFIEKPLASERVLVTIRNALDQTRLRDENKSLKRAAEVRHQMVGETQALRQVWDSIKRAAPTNATVLLLGESGSGKELVARSIHRNPVNSRSNLRLDPRWGRVLGLRAWPRRNSSRRSSRRHGLMRPPGRAGSRSDHGWSSSWPKRRRAIRPSRSTSAIWSA